jgi:hypothetical protein
LISAGLLSTQQNPEDAKEDGAKRHPQEPDKSLLQ